MAKIDTKEWKLFIIGDLFPNIVKPVVLHTRQVVESMEGVPYVVRTKFDNGIKCRVQPVEGVTPSPGGVISWGAENATFFYQAEPFLSGRDIYYIDTRMIDPLACMFLVSCLQTIAHKYPYNFGLFPELLKDEKIKLPIGADGTPDWTYMNTYMSKVMKDTEKQLKSLRQVNESKHKIDTSKWKEFRIGDLFPCIVKPVVLHTRQVVESAEGIPYVVRTKFDNGIKCRVQPVEGVPPSPAGVISWGAENATFFYQPEPFLSGRDIYYIDTRKVDPLACMFLASCLQTITHKYPYNFGLFPELLKDEKIKLPVTADGTPEWTYMADYMRLELKTAEADLGAMRLLG